MSIPESPSNTGEALDTSLESQLAQALTTLGMGELNIDIRRQVLTQVGNDVAQAVDWIMENGDRLSSWMTDMSANSIDQNLVQGTAVITKDGQNGRILQVHGDGTFDLEFDDRSPRLHLSRDEFLVDENRNESHLMEHMQSISDNVDALNFQHLEDEDEEDDDDEIENEEQSEFAPSEASRLLINLRDFPELATIFISHGNAFSGTSTSHAEAPNLRVSDRVMLSSEAGAAHENVKGPLRVGDIAEVVEVGHQYVKVRLCDSQATWWYRKSSLALEQEEVNNREVETPSLQDDLITISKPCENLLKSTKAARRICALLSSRDNEIICKLFELQVMKHISEALSCCSQPLCPTNPSATQYSSMLELMLSVSICLSDFLFQDWTDDQSKFQVGDTVGCRLLESNDMIEGKVTDCLGLGNYCIKVSGTGRVVTRSRRDLGLKIQGSQSGSPGILSNYLNELLVSRIVPLGDINVVQSFLSDGADVNATDSSGNTPLIICVDQGGSLDLVSILLEYGARVNATNLAGRSALSAAAELGRVDIVKKLLAKGANIQIIDRSQCKEEMLSFLDEYEQRQKSFIDSSDFKWKYSELQSLYVSDVLPKLLTTQCSQFYAFNDAYHFGVISSLINCVEHLVMSHSGQLASVNVVVPCFLICQDLLTSSIPRNVKAGLRLLQAIIHQDKSNVSYLGRWNILQILSDLANAKRSLDFNSVEDPEPRYLQYRSSEHGIVIFARSLLNDIELSMNVLCTSPYMSRMSDLALQISSGNIDGLKCFVDLLLSPEKVTSKELEQSGLLNAMVQFLLPFDDSDSLKISAFWEVFGFDVFELKDLDTEVVTEDEKLANNLCSRGNNAFFIFIRLLQNIISTSEQLPTPAKSKFVGKQGLKQLFNPHRIFFGPLHNLSEETIETPSDQRACACPVQSKRVVNVLVEPLTPISELQLHVLRTFPIIDARYETYCRELVGSIILDRPMKGVESENPFRRAVVEDYRKLVPSDIGVHRVRYVGPDPEDACELILAVRDYKVTTKRADPETMRRGKEHWEAKMSSSDPSDGDQRICTIMITYPHEAIPLDIFVDSVMGAILKALRQADPGQAPFGKQVGEEYDFPSRGFPEGQPEFQELFTSGLREDPFQAPVARGQTRREADTLLARLNGICEAFLKEEEGKNYMPRVEKSATLNVGRRIHSSNGRSEGTIGTVIGCESSSERYSLVYDDGIVVHNVPRNEIKDLIRPKLENPFQSGIFAAGRNLTFAIQRLTNLTGGLEEDEGPDPSALTRKFDSFIRKGEDAIPNRYDFTESQDGTLKHSCSSNNFHCDPLLSSAQNPPTIEISFSVNPRELGIFDTITHWHPITLSSQRRNLYAISNNGTTARKDSKDSFVDTLRTSTGLSSGIHRFRIRIDEAAGDDLCNHMGFIAGDEYHGSALNSNDSCCLELNDGKLNVNGRLAGANISRKPVEGDVIILQVDFAKEEFSAGIEGEGMASIRWTCPKKPVYLAVSFRRIGWTVTLLNSEDNSEEKKNFLLAQESLTKLDCSTPTYVGMQRVLQSFKSSLCMSDEKSELLSAQYQEVFDQLPYRLVFDLDVGFSSIEPRVVYCSPTKERPTSLLDSRAPSDGEKSFWQDLERKLWTLQFDQPCMKAIELLSIIWYSSFGEGFVPLVWSEVFINKQLTYKLSAVLEDLLPVTCGGIPSWCSLLPQLCPFLFSFQTREHLLKCTAFGTSQTIYELQEQRIDPGLRKRLREAEHAIGHVTEMSGDRAQRVYDRLMHAQEAIERQRIGKLKSDIARVRRGDCILWQAQELMAHHAGVTRKLEVQFADEHGFGWGVTQGFYTAVAMEMQRADDKIQIWRVCSVEDVTSSGGQYLQVGSEGLFPRPLHPLDPEKPKICARMKFLGQLMAKAFRDGFLVPLPLAPAFFAAFRGQQLGSKDLPSPSATGGIVKSMTRLLHRLEAIGKSTLSPQDRRERIAGIVNSPCTLLLPEYAGPALSVDEYLRAIDGEWPAFVDPAGFVKHPQTQEAVELCPNGSNIRLDADEVSMRKWIEAVVDLWLNVGVKDQLSAFREGVEEVFSSGSLFQFSPIELQRMLCGHQQVVWTAYISEDWLLGGNARADDERKALEENLQPIGRLTRESQIFKMLVDELISMDNSSRSKFLDLVTANPRLPPGGLPQAGIKLALRTGSRTVWAQTCAKTMYLPEYDSSDDLRAGLEEAFANAALGGFHEKNLGL